MIVTEKVEMSTANTVVKDLYDNAHSIVSTRIIKSTDLNTRLYLLGLFTGEDNQLQPNISRFCSSKDTITIYASKHRDHLVRNEK